MEALRAKIFNKVRPKSLNGRFVTGETLLELCEAYTFAINQGSVPCIESAWTYVCKQESERAMRQALQVYRTTLGQHINAQMPDYAQLKELHRKVYE